MPDGGRSAMPGARRARRLGLVATHAALVVGAVLMVIPFVWEVLTALKTLHEALASPPVLFPDRPKWSNFLTVFQAVPFAAQFRNTVVMTVLRTLGQTFLSAAAGFAFARLEFPFKRTLFAVFLSMLMIPSQLFILSQYQVIQSLGLLDSVLALALPGMFGAFGVFLMRQYYLQMPDELMDAARLDGASVPQIFFKVMLPLSRNGLVALGVLAAIWAWNDLLWPLVVNNTPDKLSLSAGLATLQGQFSTDYPMLMAGATLASMPMILLFVVFQKRMIEGIAAGSIKG